MDPFGVAQGRPFGFAQDRLARAGRPYATLDGRGGRPSTGVTFPKVRTGEFESAS